MVRRDAEALDDVLQPARGGHGLSAGHARGQVVRDDQGHRRLVLDDVQQAGQPGVHEGRVADHGDGGVHPGLGRALGHRHRRAHVHAGVDRLVGRQRAERVAADIREHPAARVVRHGLAQEIVGVRVRATRAEGRRPGHDVGRHLVGVRRRVAEGLRDDVGIQLAGARERAVQAAADRARPGVHAPQQILHQRVAVLEHQHRLAAFHHPGQCLARGRILRDFEHRVRAGLAAVGLSQIIDGDAAGDDAERAVGAFLGRVVRRVLGGGLELGQLFEQLVVIAPRDRGQQDESPGIVVEPQRVLRAGLFDAAGDVRARVGQARGQTEHHRHAPALGKVEGLADLVVGFLLVRGLEEGDLREDAEVAAVLLVLARVHRGVVGDDHDQPAVRAGDGRVHERVGGDIEPDVLHAGHRALAGERHAERLLHGRLFVAAPGGADAQRAGLGRLLDVFRDLGRGRAGVGVHAGDPGVDRRLRHRLVAQPEMHAALARTHVRRPGINDGLPAGRKFFPSRGRLVAAGESW